MNFNFYELAQEMFGVVPPQFEFIYLFIAVLLFMCYLCLIFFPAVICFMALRRV